MQNKLSSINMKGNNAIKDTNSLFQQTNIPVRIYRMTQEDLRCCESLSMRSDYRLAWLDFKDDINRYDGYNFCFKLISDGDKKNSVQRRPEGGCICYYDYYNGIVSIEMIQNFSITGGCLDGKMMTYSLITLIYFLNDIGGKGVYIIDPVTDKVCDYYMNNLKFKDVSGNRTLLYRSLSDLIDWYSSLDGQF